MLKKDYMRLTSFLRRPLCCKPVKNHKVVVIKIKEAEILFDELKKINERPEPFEYSREAFYTKLTRRVIIQAVKFNLLKGKVNGI